jgi:hypothetical protein
MGFPDLREQFFQIVEFQHSTNKRQKTSHDDSSPRIEDLTSQYPILLSLANNLPALDLLNLGLASRASWSMLSSTNNPLRLRKSLVKYTLRCSGLHIQNRPKSPSQGTPYVLPCSSKSQLASIRQCQSCGIGLCEVRLLKENA